MKTKSSSIDEQEIGQFSKDANRWWDEAGPFAPLHKLNPARLGYIKAQICAHYDRDVNDLDALKGLSILDVGCGGGLVCEPLARLGAKVTGADADPVAIEVAKEHAKQSGLKIEYLNTAIESLIPSSWRKPESMENETEAQWIPDQVREDMKRYDVVLALEIIEHVVDPAGFVESISKLVKPGGLVIFSTLNRNPKSFLLGIVAAEYILGWVPEGTHSWKKFIKPSELSRFCRTSGLKPQNISGLIFNPKTGDFEISQTDIDVNYLMTANKV